MDKCLTSLPTVIRDGAKCDIFECLFGMKTIQVKIYFYTLSKPRTITEIAKHINRDRTTAVRLTNNLVKKALISKHTEKLEKGGVRYRYTSATENEVKEMLQDSLIQMKNAVEDFISLDWTQLEEEVEVELAACLD